MGDTCLFVGRCSCVGATRHSSGTNSSSAAADMSRSCLEDFAIEGKLGTGSFGTVYKVTRKADGQQYALKEIDLRCMSEQEQEDCIQECSVLAALDSPYIIKFYDSFLQKVCIYLQQKHPADSFSKLQQQHTDACQVVMHATGEAVHLHGVCCKRQPI